MKNDQNVELIQESDLRDLSGVIDLENASEEQLVQTLKNSIYQKRERVVSDNPYLTEEVMKLGGVDASEIIVINDHVGATGT